MKKKLFYLSILFLGLVSCNSKFNIEKLEHSVTIQQDSLVIQVEIIDEAIIHVHKMMLGSKPSVIPDYVTILKPQNIAWNLKETNNHIFLYYSDY